MVTTHCRIILAEGYEQLEQAVDAFFQTIPIKTIVTTSFSFQSGSFVCAIIYTTVI